MKSFSLLFLQSLVLCEENYLPRDEHCRVLALRGGGTKGAYEVGALKAMSEMLDPIDLAYDVIEGVSIGAINAAMMASYPRGKEKDAIAFLLDFWKTHPG
jgi:predicted acylesterase/phospholipase RssA